jgi:hypothetical protein
MEVVDDTTQEETPAKVPDMAVPGLPDWGLNTKRTDVGDPLAGELPTLCLHQGRDHVTGTGSGPSQAQGLGSSGPIEIGYQMYANMRKGAAQDPPGSIAGVNGATSTVEAGLPTNTVFQPDGRATNRYDGYTYSGAPPQMEQTLTWKATNALKNLAMNNPATLAGPLPGALAGAAALGLAGLGGSALWNAFARPKKKDKANVKNWGLGGLALGAGLGALSGHLTSRNHPQGANYAKVAYSVHDRAQNHVEALLAELGRAGLPFNLVQELAVRIRNLSQPEAQRLRAAIGGLSGFSIGVFLSKHFRLGVLPGLGLSLAGGFLGANLLGSSSGRRGQRVTDYYGKPF